MKPEGQEKWADAHEMRKMSAKDYSDYIEDRIDTASGVLAADGGPPLACTDEQLEILAEYVRGFVGRLVR
jgi:hypothetical protein